ncbi:MAG: FimV/HubP family polar landmark protein [Mariprofundus sp.]|nr:FimV/HubP family polar landmark protein [Mariprofundus sp.]
MSKYSDPDCSGNDLMQCQVLAKAAISVFLFALFSCLLPMHVEALGFGALTQKSHLNEPLKAEVSLLLSETDQLSDIQVELATASEYRQMGINRDAELAGIRLTRLKKRGSVGVVRIYSVRGIHAPVLSIVLKVNKTGRGTYFRHYRLLFDAVETASLPNQKPPVVKPVAALNESVNAGVDAAAVPLMAEGWARVDRYGPVQTGDNLSQIAYRLRKDKRFTNSQVMLALYDENRSDFVDGNVNQLKKGAWLNVPDGEVIRHYAGHAPMLRLSALVHQGGQSKRLHSAAKVAVAVESTLVEKEPLQYSGQISLASTTPTQAALPSVEDKRLDAIHEALMAGKLHMTGLSESVSKLNKSVAIIKTDIQMLKEDVRAIRDRPQLVQTAMNWSLLIYIVLAAMIGLLLGLFMKRFSGAANKQALPDSVAFEAVDGDAEADQASQTVALTESETVDVLSEELVQLLKQVEEQLAQCDYDQATSLLNRVVFISPNSLHAAALRAQLFHETGRTEERNALINEISESADKDGWQRFCQLLPSQVWNACFGDS